MKKVINWISKFFSDEKGNASSKRLVGIISALTLCATLYHNSFSSEDIAPSTPLVDAVALLCFGCLGLSSIDKFTGRKYKDEPKDENPTI
jgi:hypothetical protein